MAVFCKMSVRRSKNYLEFSIAFHSCTIFEAYLINSYDFLTFDFSHFTPQVRHFRRKRRPNFLGFENLK